MAEITQETRFELSRRDLVALPAVSGQVVRCQRGLLWLTRDGDLRDILLAAGQRWCVKGGGQLVISALEDAAFSITTEEGAAVRAVSGAQAGSIADRQARWKQLPLAAYPATALR